MLITIENVLSKDEVVQFREHLARADWQDGARSAGSIARQVKNNAQLNETTEPAISLGNHILRVLAQHPLFVSAALPDRIYPPKFNSYSKGETYGAHVDGSLMQISGTNITLRTDLSATLFLADPEEYEGGELTIHTQYGGQQVKLAAGDVVLYPSNSVHQVEEITAGVRVASFFWIQSLVRDNAQRELLFNLDQSIQKLTSELGAMHTEVVNLSGVYHNMLRTWAVPS